MLRNLAVRLGLNRPPCPDPTGAALFDATARGDRATVRQIVASLPGLVGERDAAGNTALHLAVQGERGHPDHMRATACDARLLVEEEDYQAIADFLLSHRADLRARNRYGETPLHRAISVGRSPLLVELLLERGADPGDADQDGNTAMHLAVVRQWNVTELVDLLLRRGHGALLGVRNGDGKTPRELAEEKRQTPALLARLAPPDTASAGASLDAHADRPPCAPPAVPAWVHALDLLERGMPRWSSVPGTVETAWQHLAAVIGAWPRIIARHDADAMVQHVLARFVDLVAASREAHLNAACHALSTLVLAMPELATCHRAQAVSLYGAYADLWRRSGRFCEAMAYASQALQLEAGPGLATDAAIDGQACAALDGIEADFLREQLRQRATEALATIAAALAGCDPQEVGTPGFAGFLRHVTRLLEQARHAHGTLQRYGLPELAATCRALGQALPAADICKAIDDRLSVLRQAADSDRHAQFVAIANAIPALAAALAWHGHAEQARACCNCVVVAVTTPATASVIAEFDCQQHAQLAGGEPAAAAIEPAVPPRYWRSLRQQLAALRTRAHAGCADLAILPATSASLIRWNEPLPVERLQAELTADYKDLVARIIDACLATMLSPPPCPFALLGLGSMSRDDMTAYSDLEYALVTTWPVPNRSPERAWFEAFSQRFAFHMLSLGESPPRDHPLSLPGGFHLDTGAAATAAQAELIGTPAQLIEVLYRRNVANANDGDRTDQDIAFSLLTPCVAHGDPHLLDTYREAMRHTLGAQRIGDFAVRQLLADVQHLADQREADTGRIALKKRFCGPLNHALTELALAGCSGATIPRAIVADLARMKAFAPAFAADMRWALATVQTIRLRLQFQHGRACDDVAPAALTQDEREALSAIETRVVRPLWRALAYWIEHHRYPAEPADALLAHLRALDQCEPALLGFAAPEQPAPDAAIALTPAAVASLVATLAHRHAPIADMAHYYRHVMARIGPQQYGTHWLMWRDGLRGAPGGDAMLAALAMAPTADGWRGAWFEAEQHFLQRLRHWFADPTPDSIIAWTRDLDQPQGAPRQYALCPAIAKQLVGDSGDILHKPSRQRGRHVVLPVTVTANDRTLKWWVKVYPENAAMEWLVHALDRRLTGGDGTPSSVAMKIELPRERVAVLITEDVEGDNLATVMSEAPHRLATLDPRSFTRTLLRVLLTNPEDDKDDDYFLAPDQEGRLALRRIDNERAFFAAEESRRLRGDRLQVKSQLYCLDQMQAPLDRDVLSEFLLLAPGRLLKEWLEEAKALHGHYRALFGLEDLISRFERPMPCLLTVGIADGLEKQLWNRLDAIQGVIALARDDAAPLTGMDLLNRVQHRLAVHYGKAFRRYPADPARPGTAAERFLWLTADSYTVTPDGVRQTSMPGAQAVTAALNMRAKPKARDLLAIAGGTRLSPQQALERLQQLEGRRCEEILQGVLAGVRDDLRRFAGLTVSQQVAAFNTIASKLKGDPNAYSKQAQRRMLQAVAAVPFLDLTLTQFGDVLTDSLLLPIVRGAQRALWRLDLSGCPHLTVDSLVALAALCPGLRCLSLRNMSATDEREQRPLRSIQDPVLSLSKLPFGTRKLTFPSLQRLDVADNQALAAFDIVAPQLQELRIDRCPKLASVKTGSRTLRVLEARGCHALSEAALSGVTEQWEHVETVRLDDCPLLEHRWFRERCPWMAGWQWNHWSAAAVWQIDRAMRTALEAVHGTPPLPFRRRCTTWARLWQTTAQTILDRLASGKGYFEPDLQDRLKILYRITPATVKAALARVSRASPKSAASSSDGIDGNRDKPSGGPTPELDQPSFELLATLALYYGAESAAGSGTALERAASRDNTIVAELVDLLRHPCAAMRRSAALTLSWRAFRGHAEHSMTALRGLLTDIDLSVRVAAACTIERLGASADAPLTAALLGGLHAGDDATRARAARTLLRIMVADPQAARTVASAASPLHGIETGGRPAHETVTLFRFGMWLGGDATEPAVLSLLRAIPHTETERETESIVLALHAIAQAQPFGTAVALLTVLTDPLVGPPSADVVASVLATIADHVASELVLTLASPDPLVQRTALHALRHCSIAHAEEITDGLFRWSLFDCSDETVVAEYFLCLGTHAASRAEHAIDLLCMAIPVSGSFASAAALAALGKLGALQPRRVVWELLFHCGDRREPVRMAAAQALLELGDAHPEVATAVIADMHAMGHIDMPVAAIVLQGKTGLTQPALAIRTLVSMLNRATATVELACFDVSVVNTVVQQALTEALARLGAQHPEQVIQALQPLLLSGRRHAHEIVHDVFCRIAADHSHAVITALLSTVEDGRRHGLATTLQALIRLVQARPEAAADTLAPALASPRGAVRAMAAAALAHAGMVDADRLIDTLLWATGSPDAAIRSAGNIGLGQLGRAGRTNVIATLLQALRDSHEEVVLAAMRALAATGNPQTALAIRPLVATMLDANTDELRAQAAETLGQLGAARAEEVFSALKTVVLTQESSMVRAAAIRALGRLAGTQPGMGLAALIPALGDKDEHNRALVLRHLGSLCAVEPETVISVLRPLLYDVSSVVRGVAAEMLKQVGPRYFESAIRACSDEKGPIGTLALLAMDIPPAPVLTGWLDTNPLNENPGSPPPAAPAAGSDRPAPGRSDA